MTNVVQSLTGFLSNISHWVSRGPQKDPLEGKDFCPTCGRFIHRPCEKDRKRDPLDPDGLLPPRYAPLTYIRAEKSETALTISLLFNEAYRPKEPIEPGPSSQSRRRVYEQINGKVTRDDFEEKMSWQCKTHQDGTFKVSSSAKKINMIWWEAQAKKDPIAFDDGAGFATVARGEVKALLDDILEKRGLIERERVAFVNYWHGVFEKGYEPADVPYVRVQLVAEPSLHLPEMKVKSETDFTLERLYFRFVPVSEKEEEHSAKQYLSQIEAAALPKNVVIDIGGEVVKADGHGFSEKDHGTDKAYNDAFIKKYLYV